jgi:hypothetical protein
METSNNEYFYYKEWLPNVKHKEANEHVKYFGIVEFWTLLMNTKKLIFDCKV